MRRVELVQDELQALLLRPKVTVERTEECLINLVVRGLVDGMLPVAATPATLTSQIRSFCKSLSDSEPLFIPCEPVETSARFDSLSIVKRRTRVFGGLTVVGWAVYESRGYYLGAQALAVWRADSGKLVDLTKNGADHHTTLFVEDSHCLEMLERPHLAMARRKALTRSRPLNALIRLWNARDRLRIQATDENGKVRMSADQAAYDTRLAAEISVLAQELGRYPA